MTTKTLRASLLGLAAILALSACSSSGNSGGKSSGSNAASGGGSGASGSSSAAAPTGSPYVIYSAIPLTGPTGETPGVKSGGEVAAAAINAAGGVNGHPIKFVPCNTKGTPAGSQACGQAAVTDKAVAVIENQDAFGGAITATDKAGIPTIANCVCSQPDALSQTSFPTTTGPTSQAAQGTVLAALGAKTISAAVFDGAAGDTIAANVQSGLKPFNMKLKDIVKIPTTAGDLSPYVAKLKQADGINLICAPSTTLQLLRDLKQAGYTGRIVTSTALVHPTDLKGLGAAAEGIYLVGGSLPSTDTSDPGVAAFNADNKKFGGSDAATDGYAVEAWATLKMVADVMKKLPSVTPQALTEALKSGGTLEVKPVVPADFGKPVAVFAPVREFTSLFYLLQAKGGQFTAVSPKPYDMVNPPKSIP